MELAKVLMLLWLMTKCDADAMIKGLKHSLSPIAACDDKRRVDQFKKVEECHLACTSPPDSKGRVKLTIYKDASDAVSPIAVRCEKVMISQTFTETWTFSQISGPLETKSLPITLDECKEAIKRKCPDYNCDLHPPSELKADYYYASDNIQTETHLKLSRVHTTLVNQGGMLSLAIASESTHKMYNDGYWESDEENYIYLWDTSKTLTKCPFTPGVSYGCDKWKLQESINIICSQGRLAFETSGSIHMGDQCGGVRMSPEGIMYKEDKPSADTDYGSQRISMLSTNKMTGDLETVRVLAANGLAQLDSDICSLECELANLEIRTSRTQSTVVRTGAGYILLTPKRDAYECSKVIHCSMIKPYSFCGNPPRVHIKCDGRNYYWNPESNYVIVNNGCDKPREDEEFKIHLGDHIYNLDKDMTIEVPANHSSSLRTRSYLLSQGSLIDFEDLDSMRMGWVNFKSKQNESYYLSEAKSINTHSIVGGGIKDGLLSIFRYVGGSLLNVERLVVLVIVISLCVYISKPILQYLADKSGHNSRRIRRGRNPNNREYQMEFI
ncbi:TPA_asm: G [Ilex alphacytorhabdovirus 1]|nr:TPA_asm: G [Ilex alphacytorhabdovirus 1]